MNFLFGVLISLLIIINVDSSSCQQMDSIRYFPHATGNTWRWYDNLNGFTFDTRITKDSILNDGSILIYRDGGTDPRWKIGVDKNVYQFITPTECFLWFKLNAQNSDTFYTWNNSYKVIVHIYSSILFGKPTTIKKHTWYINNPYNVWYASQYLAYDFGMIKTESLLGPIEQIVTGCIIDGIRYGTMLTIEEPDIIISDQFILKQNYPNPFNSSTIIEINIPKESHVKLTLYNSLGQEVEILFTGKLSVGNYKINWDGSRFSSGTYYYCLQAGTFRKTKMLLLVK